MDTPKTFTASPGIAIILPTDEQTTSTIITGKKDGRITQGKIVSMGADTTGSGGEVIHAHDYGKEGDIVWFLHYYDEGGVDVMQVGSTKYYAVKWGDFRAKQND